MTGEGGDPFTRDLIAWQNQVLADRGLTLLALHVALVIGQHVNRQTGEAWPSQARIAEALQMTDRSVRTAIEQLVSKGHLIVAKRQSRTDSNRYRMGLDYRNEASGIDLEHRKDPSAIKPEHRKDASAIKPEHRKDPSGNGADHRNEASGNGDEYRKDPSGSTGTRLPHNHLNEPSEEIDSIPASSTRKPRNSRPKPPTSDADFDELWLCCPKKVEKAGARKAYDRIIASGAATHAEILAGMMRYAAERTAEVDRDPANVRFTKHPATWLNKGCWADAPQPVNTQHQSAQQRPGHYSFLQHAMSEIDND